MSVMAVRQNRAPLRLSAGTSSSSPSPCGRWAVCVVMMVVMRFWRGGWGGGGWGGAASAAPSSAQLNKFARENKTSMVVAHSAWQTPACGRGRAAQIAGATAGRRRAGMGQPTHLE